MEKLTKEHLENHVKYPATGKEILEACANMSDVGDEDKKKFEKQIDPEVSYQSADDVIMAVEE